MGIRTALVDNMDSFTQNVRHLFQVAGAEVTVFRSDQATLRDIEAHKPRLVLISPGPGSPQDADLSRRIIRRFAGVVPIFGICLGMQCLALEYGAGIVKAVPCHGKTDRVRHDGSGVFRGLDNPLAVGRYHSLRVASCPDGFVVNAETADGIPMAIRHRELPLAGVQFHPESFLTQQGLLMAGNVLHENL